MRSDRPVITLDGVSKRYFLNRQPLELMSVIRHPRRVLRELRREPFYAVKDVSLTIKQGEVVGVIGANGSGKSTLLRLMLGIAPPTEGTVTVDGKIGGLLELGAGFHPNATGRENVYLNGLLMGLSRNEIKQRIPEIIEFAGIEEFADQPTRTYSTGMHVRLGFAVAVHVQPDILLLDEVLAVGDSEFQEKCFAHFDTLRKQNKTVVLVSHDVVSMKNFTERVIVMEHGRVVADGDPEESIRRYLTARFTQSEATQRFFARGLAFVEMKKSWEEKASGDGS
jgi:ABC-type polysaccharide/polyol phosphate transport system ATPase subunit